MKIYDLLEEMNRQHKTYFDMPLRVTFYARVSTKRDEQLNSQENQIQTFTDLIKNNPNWIFVEGYVDTVRGESAAGRESFLRMIDDAKDGVFDLIVCKEISRFSRDILDSISYTRELLKHDVGVYFTSDNLCTIDRDSELRLGIMSSIAQQEVARLSERVKFGHKKSIENGVVLGNSRIYGYRKENKKLVIDEKEAEMVRKIFELYATGNYSLRKLETILYNDGYRSLSGGKIMHNTIKGIIENPKYKGFYCGNKVKIVDYRTKEQKFLPSNEWIMYKDETGETVPEIVDEQTWQKCNEILSAKCDNIKRNIAGKKSTSPLSGKIFCADCGCPYYHNSFGHGTKLGIKYHWICKSKKEKSTNCKSKAILDEEFYHIMSCYFKQFKAEINNSTEKIIELYKEQASSSSSRAEFNQLASKLEQFHLRQDRLFELYEDGSITKERFNDQNEKLEAQISEIKNQMNRCRTDESSMNELIQKINILRKAFIVDDFTDEEDLSKDVVLALCNALVSRIDIKPKDKNHMDVLITINTGETSTMGWDYKVTSGHTTKNVIDSIGNSRYGLFFGNGKGIGRINDRANRVQMAVHITDFIVGLGS